MFFKKKVPTRDECRIIELLLDGDTEFLSQLRSQLASPEFFMGVERRTPDTKPPIYRTPPNEYHVDIVFDENRRSKHSAGDSNSLDITDLRIRDRRLAEEIHIKGVVSKGVLTNIVAQTKTAVTWPKYLRVDDWWYGDDEQVKERPSTERLDLRVDHRGIDDLPKGWLADLLRGSFDQGGAAGLRSPASQREIKSLESELGRALPGDHRAFLGQTNGGEFWGAIVLGCAEIYALDDKDIPNGLVVFSPAEDGGVSVLDLSAQGATEESCPIKCIDHETGETTPIASSFREWLEFVANEAAEK